MALRPSLHLQDFGLRWQGWFLQDREWGPGDASLIVFIEGDSPYYSGNVMRMRFESSNFESGTYEVAYDGPGRDRVEMVNPREPAKVKIKEKKKERNYVPISQLVRYFFCSAVSLSILTPMLESLSLATSLSMRSGTP